MKQVSAWVLNETNIVIGTWVKQQRFINSRLLFGSVMPCKIILNTFTSKNNIMNSFNFYGNELNFLTRGKLQKKVAVVFLFFIAFFQSSSAQCPFFFIENVSVTTNSYDGQTVYPGCTEITYCFTVVIPDDATPENDVNIVFSIGTAQPNSDLLIPVDLGGFVEVFPGVYYNEIDLVPGTETEYCLTFTVDEAFDFELDECITASASGKHPACHALVVVDFGLICPERYRGEISVYDLSIDEELCPQIDPDFGDITFILENIDALAINGGQAEYYCDGDEDGIPDGPAFATVPFSIPPAGTAIQVTLPITETEFWNACPDGKVMVLVNTDGPICVQGQFELFDELDCPCIGVNIDPSFSYNITGPTTSGGYVVNLSANDQNPNANHEWYTAISNPECEIVQAGSVQTGTPATVTVQPCVYYMIIHRIELEGCEECYSECIRVCKGAGIDKPQREVSEGAFDCSILDNYEWIAPMPGAGNVDRLFRNIGDESHISISPNPASSNVVVELPKNAENVERKLLVFDVTGRTIISQVLPSDQLKHNINVSELQEGFYFFSIYEKGNETVTRRITVTR